jgi:hypothetical protein
MWAINLIIVIVQVLAILASLYILAEIKLTDDKVRMGRRLIKVGIKLLVLSILIGIGVFWLKYSWAPASILFIFAITCIVRGLSEANYKNVVIWLDKIIPWIILALVIVIVILGIYSTLPLIQSISLLSSQ